MVTSAQIFKQIEIADNFLKYAKPGTEDKTRERARRRYEKALKIAMAEAADRVARCTSLLDPGLATVPAIRAWRTNRDLPSQFHRSRCDCGRSHRF